MDRRSFIVSTVLSVGGSLARPGIFHGQEPTRRARVGFLSAISEASVAPNVRALRESLRERGWIEGQNLRIDYSYDAPGGRSVDERATELTMLAPHLIVADSTPTSLALQRIRVSLPVVFAAVSEPVEIGLVESLARPGRNFTGFTTVNRELMPKRVELAKELVPRVRRLVYLGNPDYASSRHNTVEVTEVAGRLGLRVEAIQLRRPEDLDAIDIRPEQRRDTVFVVEQSQFFIQHVERMVAAERRTKIPAIYADRQFVDRGGTICYGVNRPELFRRTGGYVDRILHGVRAADLPVEQPTKFDVVINRQTARTLGLSIPRSLLLRADQVIE
ncbi:MAG TPA: ABC transporter substrate-binding protein [Candidatus Bathyarchaeia archaeon]|nr:ABC transporter substrate-binding protein [Candidatus Bathyarchaeia archaeon]